MVNGLLSAWRGATSAGSAASVTIVTVAGDDLGGAESGCLQRLVRKISREETMSPLYVFKKQGRSAAGKAGQNNKLQPWP
jgi:hypothetical protein